MSNNWHGKFRHGLLTLYHYDSKQLKCFGHVYLEGEIKNMTLIGKINGYNRASGRQMSRVLNNVLRWMEEDITQRSN